MNQIQKNAKDIDNRLVMIENANLFKSPPQKYADILPSCKVGLVSLVTTHHITSQQFLQFYDYNFSAKIGDAWSFFIWTASSEFGTYCLCEQQRFSRACASAQSRQNLRCSLIQAVSQEEPSDRKPDPWPLWMAGHAQLKFVMTECSKTQIRLMGLIWIKYLCTYFTRV